MILAFVYWEGDREEAYRLVRYAAAIEQARFPTVDRADVSVVLVRKSGTSTDGLEDLLAEVARSFRVCNAVCTEPVDDGYVQGANTTFFAAMNWASLNKDDAVFVMTADCAPMSLDWIDVIAAEHAAARVDGKHATGVVCAAGVPPHLNGNAVYDSRWLVNRKFRELPHYAPFDVFQRADMLPISRNCPRMVHGYAANGWSTEDLRGMQAAGIVWCHGFKDHGATLLRARSLVLGDVSPEEQAQIDALGPRKPNGISQEWIDYLTRP